ncbi:hypothetical protein E2C01_058665 [Portunus trituberculatus]|uniref:Uncharacterized protein n=1 Tax=Portunus trituberculatus TaxID=210409 RepID=A0A5B7H5C3_PORTR|nr:hypothetical protein [Portunus trituberculatus]
MTPQNTSHTFCLRRERSLSSAAKSQIIKAYC